MQSISEANTVCVAVAEHEPSLSGNVLDAVTAQFGYDE